MLLFPSLANFLRYLSLIPRLKRYFIHSSFKNLSFLARNIEVKSIFFLISLLKELLSVKLLALPFDKVLSLPKEPSLKSWGISPPKSLLFPLENPLSSGISLISKPYFDKSSIRPPILFEKQK